MKKTIVSLALLLATNMMAGSKQPYHVNVNAGLNIFDDSTHLEDTSLYGVSATIYEQEAKKYAFQMSYEHINKAEYEGIVLDTSINRYSINMIVDGDEELNITPYILLGGGYESLSTIYEEYPDTKNQAFLNAGLGFKYRLNDYFNVTLEGKALGKFDSESVDYVAKFGLDFMFGGKSEKKAPILEALGKPKTVERPKVKPIIKELKKAKPKWITPEVVAEMFDESRQEVPAKKVEDSAIADMQAHLKVLKAQMAKNEALLTAQLAKLEEGLASKKREEAKVEEPVTMQSVHEKAKKKAMLAKEKARLALVEQAAILKKQEAKKALMAEERANKLKKEKREKAARLKKKRIAAQRKAKAAKRAAMLKAKKLAQAKAKAAKKAAMLKAKKLAQAKAAAAAELAEFKRQKALQLAEEKRLAKEAEEKAAAAAQKAEQERVDVLYIRNGMVVFAD